MEVPAARLKSALDGTTTRCFFVHGAETLLVDEARGAIRAHLAARGYGDVSRYTAEAGFDFSALTRSSRSRVHCASSSRRRASTCEATW